MMRSLLRAARNRLRRAAYGLGDGRECYICRRTFSRFTAYAGGTKALSPYLTALDIVGSDLDAFGCVYCGSFDRERHLCMYFDALNLWERVANARVLHFAPEVRLARRIAAQHPLEYVKADLYPETDDTVRMDAAAIPLDDSSVDLVIADHVLEHIPQYTDALAEIRRVLVPGGVAILQTPYSRVLRHTFEDPGVTTDEQRTASYGQWDHVRVFSEHDLFKSLEAADFELELARHEELFDAEAAHRYGVNADEPLIRVVKGPAPAAT